MEGIRSRLRGGETLLGTMLTLPSPAVAEILAGAGFDWLFIDGEHGPLETADLEAALRAARGDTACLVRVPEPAEVPIKKALDLGADGIIAPQVNTPAQAADVARFSRYAPAGARGVGLGRAHGYGYGFADYLATANDDIAVVVQAEHVRAVENIEAIVAVEGVDAVLLGPYDLSASLGRIGEVDHPDVVAALEHVVATCLEARMPLGLFGVSTEAVAPWVERGVTLVVAGVDALMLGHAATSMQSALAALRRD